MRDSTACHPLTNSNITLTMLLICMVVLEASYPQLTDEPAESAQYQKRPLNSCSPIVAKAKMN